MFPNKEKPNFGVFVKERIKSIAEKVETTIVAPVPHFPLIHLMEKYSHTKNIRDNEEIDGLHVYHPRYLLIPRLFKYLDGLLYYISLNRFFVDILQKGNHDILDFHWVYPDAYAGLRWARLYKKKIVVTIRGNESICYSEKSLRKRILIDTLRSVDHIIAVSNDMKNKVVNEYGVDGKKVTVIPNGIDNHKFSAYDKQKARIKCNLDPGKRYVLSLCRLSEEKGLEHLFRAFSLLDEPDLNLLVVGDGPLHKQLKSLANELNINDKVSFLGEVPHEEVCCWYNAADVYCLPSLWEGCPNVVIESIACGTPVVATDVGGVPDMNT
jgi:glycosyltransferase involved in cell wall biosynthesis